MQQMHSATDEPVSLARETAQRPDDATPDACAALLLETVPAVMRNIRTQMRAQRTAGISVAQFRALGYVGRHAGASLSAVAEHLGLTPPATSRLVDGLVARGMMRREVSPADRRAVMLALTPEGEALQAQARAGALSALVVQVAELPEGERVALMAALRQLRALFATEARDRSEDG
jgi:DNA-binding MarR family transcriptional regulator